MTEKEFYIKINRKKVAVSEAVYREYRRAAERERYQTKRCRQGTSNRRQTGNPNNCTWGKEISYEQLRERGWDIADNEAAVEEIAERAYLMEGLERALHKLKDEELDLIQELFYLEKSEREAAKRLGISQPLLHYRKNRVLEKLRGFMENF